MTGPHVIERAESVVLAALSLIATFTLYPAWWWLPFAAFVLFDVSALGYLRSLGAGAASYNIVHNYAWPAGLAIAALTTAESSNALSVWCGIAACAWAFHVSVDRSLGYGLKRREPFSRSRGAGARPRRQGLANHTQASLSKLDERRISF